MTDPAKIAEQAVAYLQSITGAEASDAKRAVNILRSSLDKVDTDRRTALDELQYGLSAKGILELQWEDKTYTELSRWCYRYYEAWKHGV